MAERKENSEQRGGASHNFAERSRYERKKQKETRSNCLDQLLVQVQEEIQKLYARIEQLTDEITLENQGKEEAERELEKQRSQVTALKSLQDEKEHLIEELKNTAERQRTEMARQKNILECQTSEHEQLLAQVENLKRVQEERQSKLDEMKERQRVFELEREQLLHKIAILEAEKRNIAVSKVKQTEEDDLKKKIHEIQRAMEDNKETEKQVRNTYEQRIEKMEEEMKKFTTREQLNELLKETKLDTNIASPVHDEEILTKIRTLFVSSVIPNNILHLFHHYNRSVLVQQDIEVVTSVASNYGKIHGAGELLSCLVRYKDWFSCVIQVLRDPRVKQGHVADAMWNVLGMGKTRDKTDSLDDVKEKIKTAVKTLRPMKVVWSEDAIHCLKFIRQTYRDYPSFKRDVGDFLSDLSYTDTCIKILGEKLTETGLGDNNIWPVIDNTLNTCWNYSAASAKFAKRLAESGAVHLMSNILRQQHYLDHLDRERETKVVKASITVLYNIAVEVGNIVAFKDNETVERETRVVKASITVLHNIAVQVGNIAAFKDSKTVEVLMSLTRASNENIKLHAVRAIVRIVGEKERDKLTVTSDLIDTLVQGIHKAVDNTTNREYEGYSAGKLTKFLATLAVADSNKEKIVKANTLELFLTLLTNTHQDWVEQSQSAECLYQLSHNDHIKQEIQEFPHLVSTMEQLKDSDDPDVRQSVRRALWKIKGEEEESLDEIKEEIKTAARRLEQITDYLSKDFIKSLKVIGHTSWDYPSYRTDIGDLLCEFSCPETCIKILREELQVSKLEDNNIWPVIYNTLCTCCYYSADSTKFAKRLAETGLAVHFMSNILRQQHFLDHLDKERETLVVKTSIAVLHNMAVHIGSIIEFRDSKTVEVVIPLIKSKNELIKVCAMMTLAHIVEEEEKDKLTDSSDLIQKLVDWIPKALEDKVNRSYNGASVWALSAALAKLAVNDINKGKIVTAGALDVFVIILRHADPKIRDRGGQLNVFVSWLVIEISEKPLENVTDLSKHWKIWKTVKMQM